MAIFVPFAVEVEGASSWFPGSTVPLSKVISGSIDVDGIVVDSSYELEPSDILKAFYCAIGPSVGSRLEKITHSMDVEIVEGRFETIAHDNPLGVTNRHDHQRPPHR